MLVPQLDDGMARLRFGRGTFGLPMHVHAYPDGLTVVLEGGGFFHLSPTPVDAFTGRDVPTIRARCGDVLVSLRGLAYTFSAPVEELALLSHHGPLIPFDDPR